MFATPKQSADDYTNEPLYWFAVLDRAVAEGDHQTAATAQQELARLGVDVRYRRRPQHPEVAHAE
jgi:hypothetical protein